MIPRLRKNRRNSRSSSGSESLSASVAFAGSPGADAVASELGKAQEQVTHLESRRKEITAGLATLDAQAVDRDDLARALEAFDGIWSVLLTHERERVLRLLIKKIDYDGGTGKLDIAWRLGGFNQLVREIGS